MLALFSRVTQTAETKPNPAYRYLFYFSSTESFVAIGNKYYNVWLCMELHQSSNNAGYFYLNSSKTLVNTHYHMWSFVFIYTRLESVLCHILKYQ